MKALRPRSATVVRTTVIIAALSCTALVGKFAGTVLERASADSPPAPQQAAVPAFTPAQGATQGVTRSVEARRPVMQGTPAPAATAAASPPSHAMAATTAAPELAGADVDPSVPARVATRVDAQGTTDGRSVAADGNGRIAGQAAATDTTHAAGHDDSRTKHASRKAKPRHVAHHGHSRWDYAGHYPQWGFAQQSWSSSW